jgi:hypothetical protein
MKVPEFATHSVIRLEMPYEMYRWVLYCLATYDNPRDHDAVELHKNAFEFAESLGAESPHHFISENLPFMQCYYTQLVKLSQTATEQARIVLEALEG